MVQRLHRVSFHPEIRRSVPDHCHPEAEWHYVLDGRCGFRIGRRVLRIGPGDLFRIAPQTVHGVHVHEQGDRLIQVIVGVGDEDPELVRAWRRRAGAAGTVAVGGGRHAWFAALGRDLASGDRWRARAAALRFETLLCEAVGGGTGVHPVQPTHPALERALECMRRRLDRALTLAELARAAGVDKHHLSRLFSARLGCPPVRFHQRLRLDWAAELLRSSTFSVAEVAQAAGFSDPYHFSRAFRAWRGRAPSLYRAESGRASGSSST